MSIYHFCRIGGESTMTSQLGLLNSKGWSLAQLSQFIRFRLRYSSEYSYEFSHFRILLRIPLLNLLMMINKVKTNVSIEKIFPRWHAAEIKMTCGLPRLSWLTWTWTQNACTHSRSDHSGSYTLSEWTNKWMATLVSSNPTNSRKSWASRILRFSLA